MKYILLQGKNFDNMIYIISHYLRLITSAVFMWQYFSLRPLAKKSAIMVSEAEFDTEAV